MKRRIFGLLVHNAYPTDAAAVQTLAQQLTAAGYRATQTRSKMDTVKIGEIAELMARNADEFWASVPNFKKIVIGPGGEVMDGHHRVIAAILSKTPIPEDQIFRASNNLREVFD